MMGNPALPPRDKGTPREQILGALELARLRVTGKTLEIKKERRDEIDALLARIRAGERPVGEVRLILLGNTQAPDSYRATFEAWEKGDY